jgi:transketolase
VPPNKQGTSATHGSPLGGDEVAATRTALGWAAEAFVVPDDVAAAWRGFGQRGASARSEWAARLAASPQRAEFEARIGGNGTPGPAFAAYVASLAEKPPVVATRKASENALTALTADIPAMVGGSADLTGSNNTKTGSTAPLTRDNYAGRYVYYGIREFGMSAAMNGMALHGGIIPYGGTFLVFADYCRAAIRLSALQRQRVVYVMTHDSIGLGEDGPTHQPIEHLQSLRAMPNLLVMRPADALETAECWALALAQKNRPSLLALTRQNLPPLRTDIAENRCAKGGYRLKAAENERRVVLIATGSEVSLALDVAKSLETQGIGADVISMVSTTLFDEQSDAYQADILGDGGAPTLRVSIEAGTTFGWERYTGRGGLRFGIDSFGASAPIDALYDHFGLTEAKITPQIIAALG